MQRGNDAEGQKQTDIFSSQNLKDSPRPGWRLQLGAFVLASEADYAVGVVFVLAYPSGLQWDSGQEPAQDATKLERYPSAR